MAKILVRSKMTKVQVRSNMD